MTKKAEDCDYIKIFIIDTTKSRAHIEMADSMQRLFKASNDFSEAQKSRKMINNSTDQTPTQ